MKRTALALFGVMLGVVLIGKATPRQTTSQTEIPTEKLVAALRTLNTAEYMYRKENGRFADREQMLNFLRQKGLLSKSSIDLENPKPYELAVTTTSDGTHYQIT